MPERVTGRGGPEREVSRGRSSRERKTAGKATRLPEAAGSASGEGPNGRESETNVSLGKEGRQKTAQAELPLESRGEAPRVQRSGEARTATSGNERSGTATLMERVVERSNVETALKRVRRNQGSPGRDQRPGDDADGSHIQQAHAQQYRMAAETQRFRQGPEGNF